MITINEKITITYDEPLAYVYAEKLKKEDGWSMYSDTVAMTFKRVQFLSTIDDKIELQKCSKYEQFLTSCNSLLGGIQYLYKFPNNYGASVVKHQGSYGYHDNLWELTVIIWDNDKFNLIYSTPVANDVLGYLTDDDVANHLEQIKDLQPKDE